MGWSVYFSSTTTILLRGVGTHVFAFLRVLECVSVPCWHCCRIHLNLLHSTPWAVKMQERVVRLPPMLLTLKTFNSYRNNCPASIQKCSEIIFSHFGGRLLWKSRSSDPEDPAPEHHYFGVKCERRTVLDVIACLDGPRLRRKTILPKIDMEVRRWQEWIVVLCLRQRLEVLSRTCFLHRPLGIYLFPILVLSDWLSVDAAVRKVWYLVSLYYLTMRLVRYVYTNSMLS